MHKYLVFTPVGPQRDEPELIHEYMMRVFHFRARSDKTAIAIARSEVGEISSVYRITGGLKVQKVPVHFKGIPKLRELSHKRIGFKEISHTAHLIRALQPVGKKSS